jgi:hypothetical protein
MVIGARITCHMGGFGSLAAKVSLGDCLGTSRFPWVGGVGAGGSVRIPEYKAGEETNLVGREPSKRVRRPVC